MRAFAAGWGGAVWKTLGEPIVNVTSRFAGLNIGATKMIGMNNIELITDRPLDDNLREIAECKAAYPDRADRRVADDRVHAESWHELVRRVQTVPVDGFELNFGCPHGMSERGKGRRRTGSRTGRADHALGQGSRARPGDREAHAEHHRRALHRARRGARRRRRDQPDQHAQQLMGVDLDTWNPIPHVDGKSSHGGFCGPAVKPIALNMVGACARDAALGSRSRDRRDRRLARRGRVHADGLDHVQVCTAVMHHGFRIVGDMIDGLNNYLDERGIARRARSSARPCRASSTGTTSTSTTRSWRASIPNLHPLQQVLHRVRRRGPPVHRPAGRSAARAWSSTRNTASAATCAAWCARSRTASRWCASTSGTARTPGENGYRYHRKGRHGRDRDRPVPRRRR
jgi:hypothetical protein